ncbi:MAG: UMP kinase [Treponema sp.]|jgi:uridylate kinase|nr:UMP kinase [Treponema sp.]
MITVISLGGSIVAPDTVDAPFLKDFISLIKTLLAQDPERRFIFVVGGGGPARTWQQAYRVLSGTAVSPEQADWIGIMATRLNAELIRGICGAWCTQAVVTDPTQAVFEGRVLVAAGWKPGFSSDYDAVLLAERFKADRVINLSNIEQVYTDDPRTNPDAKPLDTLSWAAFRALVGDAWTPGKNVPFDPVASRHAAQLGLLVICAAGRNLENLKKILQGEPFVGTAIGPL